MHREIAQQFHVLEVAWPIHFLGGDGDDAIFMDGLKDHVSSQLGCLHDAQDVNFNHHTIIIMLIIMMFKILISCRRHSFF